MVRSTKAGAETPATPQSTCRPGWPWASLNEGRGRDPGDTSALLESTALQLTRSTKAGAETPATHVSSQPELCVLDRSTKAGAETPATHASPPPFPFPPTTLNEGRGRDPGDTPSSIGISKCSRRAQRRPGPRPRRHVHRSLDLPLKDDRSTKAGAETPATHVHRIFLGRGIPRSTKAGAETPATPRRYFY